MSEPAFTPGPWRLVPRSFSPSIFVVRADAGDDERAIAEVIDTDAADLIAAAPALYSALMDAKFWIGPDDRMSPKLATKIDTALALARGETPNE